MPVRISAVVRAGDGRIQHVFEGKVSLCLAVYRVWGDGFCFLYVRSMPVRISAVVQAGDKQLQHVFEGKVSLCLAVYSVWGGWLLFSVCAFNACAYQCCRASRRWKNTACV